MAKVDYVEQALSDFLSRIKDADVVVAESAVLRHYILPDKFIIVDRAGAKNKKKYIQELMPLADCFMDDVFDQTQIDNIFKT